MATKGPYRGSCFCQLIVCLYIRCHFKHLMKVTCTSWRSVILEHYHRPFSIPRRSNVIQIQFLHVHHMIRTPTYPMPVLYALNRKNHAKIHYTGEPMHLNCGIKIYTVTCADLRRRYLYPDEYVDRCQQQIKESSHTAAQEKCMNTFGDLLNNRWCIY